MLEAFDLGSPAADGALVWLEVTGGPEPEISQSSLEVLGKAAELGAGRVFGMMFGGSALRPLYGEAFSRGADTVYHIRDGRLSAFHPEAYCEAARDLAERIRPSVILMGATPRGRELAPRLASALSAGLTADCTGLRMEGGSLVMTRPAFGGDLIADIVCEGRPQMATVRPGVFPAPPPAPGRKGTAICRGYGGSSLKDIAHSAPVPPDGGDISRAKVLVSLGRGAASREALEAAESVAARLGGMVSCSRALVDRGLLPQSRQVGQSGRSVRPDVYLAFGISGSVQHKAGMRLAKRVIAVNKDPDAPIRDDADLFIEGDALSVLRELDKALRSPL
jgi:electron transfer flavoprotein alpha subunit